MYLLPGIFTREQHLRRKVLFSGLISEERRDEAKRMFSALDRFRSSVPVCDGGLTPNCGLFCHICAFLVSPGVACSFVIVQLLLIKL